MDIGIIGWWHHDNQGDLAMLDNVTRALVPHRVVPIDTGFPINADTLHRLNRLDFLLLGGGTQFQATPPLPFDTFDGWGTHLQTRLGAIGMGVDQVAPSYRSAVTRLVEQAEFFYVRDRASQQAIGHPKVQVAPDITFLSPIVQSTIRPGATSTGWCGVNLRNSPGLDVKPWIDVLKQMPFKLRGIPLSTYSAWQERQILQQLDETCATGFRSSLYRQLDLMIGTAYHSIVFAIQAAVPVIAIAYAPKVRHFMRDIGLDDYVLDADEWHKLPALADRVFSERSELAGRLYQITANLTQSIQQVMEEARTKIERSPSRSRSGPKVSLVVIGGTSPDDNDTSVESCLNQTYSNIEVLFIGDDPAVSAKALPVTVELKVVRTSAALSQRLNLAFSCATGEYYSWVQAGDFYARDAIDCMTDRLQREPALDVVFTDYYMLQECDRIVGAYAVDESHKLIRRNVVGPCFLYRRRLAEVVGEFQADTLLPDYDYWLRAKSVGQFRPLHVPLFYKRRIHTFTEDTRSERQVRRQWRLTQSWPRQAAWRVLDTELMELLLIRPLLAIRRKIKNSIHK